MSVSFPTIGYMPKSLDDDAFGRDFEQFDCLSRSNLNLVYLPWKSLFPS